MNTFALLTFDSNDPEFFEMSEINHEAVLIQVKDELNRNKIKLWEEPYCIEGESVEASLTVRKNSFQNKKSTTQYFFLCPRI